jgi:hypothetical protein
MKLQGALLERAAAILGGMDILQRRLGADSIQLQRWREDRARLPEPIFLYLVDIVLRDDVARARNDRRRHTRSVAPPDRARAGAES